MSEKLGKSHFILPLPSSGIPAKVRRLIEGTRKRYGVAHVNFYQTPELFRARIGRRADGRHKYMRTFFWIEVSNQPLKRREKPDWPLYHERRTLW